jgi:hypothetical protein
MFTVTLVALLMSILLAMHRTEKRRAFWLGFALFGWAYMALTVMPSIESRLITTKALAHLRSKVAGRSLIITTVRQSGTWRLVVRFTNNVVVSTDFW